MLISTFTEEMSFKRMGNFPETTQKWKKEKNSNPCHLKLMLCHLSHSEIISVKRWTASSLELELKLTFSFQSDGENLCKWIWCTIFFFFGDFACEKLLFR